LPSRIASGIGTPCPAMMDFYAYDGGSNALDDSADGARIGIEQLSIGGGIGVG
jgi:hypothetical protein